MPHFTVYWDWPQGQIEDEIAALENLTPARLATFSTGEKQRRTMKLQFLRLELTSRAEWKQAQARAATKNIRV